MSDPLELREHPAMRRNAITTLLEPLFPDQHSIWLHGDMIGYCGAVPGKPICLIQYFGATERDMILEFVASKGLAPSIIVCPPKKEIPLEMPPWATGGSNDDEQ